MARVAAVHRAGRATTGTGMMSERMVKSETAREQRVTRVSFQARDQSRVNVFVEGRFAFAVSAVQAIERGLKPGRILTPADLIELRHLEELERARTNAMLLLARRPRSRRELTSRLERKGYPPEVVARVMEELEARGYVDDQAFARYWIENRQANRPRGRQALAAELRAKGVQSDVIRAAIEPLADDEEEVALTLARQRARGLRADDEVRFRQRLGSFLQRKGYRYDVVRAVVNRVLRERDTEAVEHEGSLEPS